MPTPPLRSELDEVDLKTITNDPPWWGQTPLYLACMYGNKPKSIPMIEEILGVSGWCQWYDLVGE